MINHIITDIPDPDAAAGIDTSEREPLTHAMPPEFERELYDLKALNEWKHGGILVLSAPPLPRRLPLWRGLLNFGRGKP